METLGNIFHTVGEKVGIVAADEKKDEGAAPPAPAPASGPGPTEPADHEEKRGIFGTIAEAAKNVFAPPPLEVDPGPEEIEPIAPPAPSAPEKKEEKPVTFLGDLLQKVEHKIEETLPYVSPLTEKKVDVSAFGSVFDPQEDVSGKVTPPSVPRVISETKPAENPLGAKLSAPLRTESAEGNTSVMAEWAGRTKDLSGIDKADLQRVQDEVDKVVKQSTADRRTSISAVSSSSSSSSVEKNKNKNKKKNRRRHQKEKDVDVEASDVARRADYEKIEDANDKLLKEAAEKEATEKEAAKKEAHEKLLKEKDANDKLLKEAAKKEAAKKEAAKKEAAEKEAKEKLLKEKEANEKLLKEAAEKEAKEKEATKKEAKEKLLKEKDANEKLLKEAAEKETNDKLLKEKEDKTPVVDPAILADVLEKVNDILEPTLPKLTPEVAFGKPSHERHPGHQKHPEPTRQLHERTPAAYDVFQPAHSDQA